MDDLALIFSHHNNKTSRKQLHEEDQVHEKANSLSCIISFNNNFENSLLIPKGGANNTISFSNINNNTIGTQFGGNTRRTGEQAHEHLLAERSRRRKIAKLFVSLASLLPDLNKMDKTSILEGAANLIRQLGERAKEDDHQSSIDMMMKSTLLPEVEVKSLEKELLITILLYFKNQQKGIIDEILTMIQKLQLTIKITNFIPFGSTSMHITVIAQMNEEFCETTDVIAEKLRSSIIKFKV
ncbi:transcription factor bHLH18-like [Solanum dulcamara]|uniref:transcription factor bHLH18-like n=1 Tax=Solanum dulcamara TaxID=45834 RepID=UPI0024859EC3|nr:transcription factor bHLH18-like [Solanum dulcamara]